MFTHGAVSPSLADKTSLSDLAHKKQKMAKISGVSSSRVDIVAPRWLLLRLGATIAYLATGVA